MKLVIEGSEDDKVLHRRAKRVDKVDDTIRMICKGMEEIMDENSGLGISGNQVGILKRIIIVRNGDITLYMINPEIITIEDEWEVGEEGCLSLPETFIHKKRLKSVKVKYRGLTGKPYVEEYGGLTARIIQHEIDHLDGILMIDKNESQKYS